MINSLETIIFYQYTIRLKKVSSTGFLASHAFPKQKRTDWLHSLKVDDSLWPDQKKSSKDLIDYLLAYFLGFHFIQIFLRLMMDLPRYAILFGKELSPSHAQQLLA